MDMHLFYLPSFEKILSLEKMHTGEYGVCEGTDEPIGFKRLELRPWTRYSVGYKEMLEREKAQQAR